MDRSSVRSRLKAFICSELLNNPDYPLEGDMRLISDGLINSYSLVQIAVFIEQSFGVYVTDTELGPGQAETLDSLASAIVKNAK